MTAKCELTGAPARGPIKVRVVKRRIENHEVPADVVRDLPAEGSA